MTATQVARPPRPTRPSGPTARPVRGPGRPDRGDGGGLLLATEIASLAVTAAAIAGMHLLFSDGTFLGPLLVQVLLAHVVTAALRRSRVRLLPAALLAAGAAILAITWTQYMDTTIALLPTPSSLSAINADMEAAWQMFRDVRAPAPVVPGFIVTTSITIWVIVFISDWGAFRTGVSFEALLPQATLFLFAAVLGAEGGRASGAALFVAAALVFLLLHRTWRQEGTATWAALHRQRGRSSLLTSGSALAALAVILGGILGPKLPGADDDAILPWRDFTEKREPRQVVSPLVDIQRKLVDQKDTEFFNVRVDDPDFEGAYWRITALDEFDGRIWRSTYQTKNAEGDLPDSVTAETETTHLEQTVAIKAMNAIWLPAAFEPAAIDTKDSETSVDYDPDSATLIVDNEAATSDGMTYMVTSDVPTWSETELRGAPQRIPEDIRDRYLELPDDFSPNITDLTAQILENAGDNRYDQARALMDYFRGPNSVFQYSLDVPDRPNKHSISALEDFLFNSHTGYCEQFAGSFAAMARSAGIPARVVVGFTAGQNEPSDPQLWRVTGRQAHAWVEVYFQGLGWVTFDPTPGRGPDQAEAWLGPDVQGGQQDTGEPGAADDPNTDPGATPDQPDPSQAPGQSPNNNEGVAIGANEEAAQQAKDEDDGFIPPGVATAGRGLGIGVLIYLAIVPLALVAMRELRRRRARLPDQRVSWAWQTMNEEVADAGLRLSPALTVTETAGRVSKSYPSLRSEIDLVANWVEQINYAEQSPTPEDADAAMAAGTRVASAATRRLPWYVRVLRYLDARRLLPRSREARRSAHGAARSRL